MSPGQCVRGIADYSGIFHIDHKKTWWVSFLQPGTGNVTQLNKHCISQCVIHRSNHCHRWHNATAGSHTQYSLRTNVDQGNLKIIIVWVSFWIHWFPKPRKYKRFSYNFFLPWMIFKSSDNPINRNIGKEICMMGNKFPNIATYS